MVKKQIPMILFLVVLSVFGGLALSSQPPSANLEGSHGTMSGTGCDVPTGWDMGMWDPPPYFHGGLGDLTPHLGTSGWYYDSSPFVIYPRVRFHRFRFYWGPPKTWTETNVTVQPDGSEIEQPVGSGTWGL